MALRLPHRLLVGIAAKCNISALTTGHLLWTENFYSSQCRQILFFSIKVRLLGHFASQSETSVFLSISLFYFSPFICVAQNVCVWIGLLAGGVSEEKTQHILSTNHWQTLCFTHTNSFLLFFFFFETQTTWWWKELSSKKKKYGILIYLVKSKKWF